MRHRYHRYHAELARVVDGDTIVVRFRVALNAPGLHLAGFTPPVRVRLTGIDAPEAHDRGGPEATAFAARVLDVATAAYQNLLTVLTDDTEDNFGRLLADVALPQGGTLTEALLDSGHAVAYQESE